MKWHDIHNRKTAGPLRQWARHTDGTWYGIYPAANQGSARWTVHRRLAGEKFNTGVGNRRTLADARQCAEDDLAQRGAA